MSGLQKLLHVVVMFSLVCGSTAAGQGARGGRSNWDNLRKLKSEARVFVATTKGAEYEGEFRGVTDDALLLTDVEGSPTAVVEVARGEVREVRKIRSSVVRHLIGGAVGVGVAVGVGAVGIAAAKASDAREGVPLAPLLAIPAGILVGGFIGDHVAQKSLRKGARVYVAP